ncbi:NAD-dependent protein deacetylase [Parahaliea maris]|uniref:protein acetyllysine N-acetyltransferase n=1 Tax=Parahaliea maris TaxID=2716870 RepID=A0A5C8ZZH4_9GAMM|nr:NAD-dependent protein deacetylase [Parahaliea maris]TXS93022.1 NAD-dependent protein deacetylase [Parahaliea maris]
MLAPPITTTTAATAGARELARFMRRHPRIVVLTGAGISKGSGIPTYRDEKGTWLHSQPITHQAYLGDEHARRRYWSRSLQGWPAIRDARPNAAHLSLSALQRQGRVGLIVTQNVDRLHQRAGSRNVIDLHGRVDRVICTGCGEYLPREALQQRFARLGFHPLANGAAARPDGDADLPESSVLVPPIPHCEGCNGLLMPDVVFFGGAIPRARVETVYAAIDEADALLVIGSSLQVYSGFRFCKHAAHTGKPIALLNPGTSRADPLATLRLPLDCAAVLENLPAD